MRYLELAVFPEETMIPQVTLERYWAYTGALSAVEVEQLCLDLADFSLAEHYSIGRPAQLRLHAIIHTYLKRRVGSAGPDQHRNLLDAYHMMAGQTWRDLPQSEPYLLRRVTYHLAEAGLADELDLVATDFQRILTVLSRYGPADVETDLSLSASPLAVGLRRCIAQNAHLLAPVGPDNAVAATLLSRLNCYESLIDYARAASTVILRPFLSSDWPLPDVPPTALMRALHIENPCCVAISPDGIWLAVGAATTVELWRTDGVQRTVLTGPVDNVLEVAISRDRAWLAATEYRRNTIRLWRADGTPGAVITSGAERVHGLAISADGTWLAVGAGRTVEMWNVDGTLRGRLSGHADDVNDVVISRDGWLASGCRDNTIHLWQADGEPFGQFPCIRSQGNLTGLAVSPNGAFIAVCHGGTVSLWNINGTLRTVLYSDELVGSVVISSDSMWLAIPHLDGSIHLWTNQGSPMEVLAGHFGGVTRLALSPDGSRMASLSPHDGTVRVWDTADIATRKGNDLARRFADVAVVHNGRWLVASELVASRIWLWSSDRSQTYLIAQEPERRGGRLAFGPDGTWLVTGDHNRTELSDVEGNLTEDLIKAVLPRHPVAVSPDGEWVAAATETGGVRLWSTEGALLTELAGHDPDPRKSRYPTKLLERSRRVNCVAISSDGTWLATGGSDHAVRLWDASGAPRAVLVGHEGAVTDVAISSDGTWLASNSSDKTIRLWHSSGVLRGELNGHAAHLSISPDSRWLAVVGDDQAIRLWDATTLACVTALRVESRLTRVVWFPDGERIGVCGEHGLYVLRANWPTVDDAD